MIKNLSSLKKKFNVSIKQKTRTDHKLNFRLNFQLQTVINLEPSNCTQLKNNSSQNGYFKDLQSTNKQIHQSKIFVFIKLQNTKKSPNLKAEKLKLQKLLK